MSADTLVVIGSGGYIGSYLTEYAKARQLKVIPASSQDCNFLDRRQVVNLFRSLSNIRCSVAFLSVVNKSAGQTAETFDQNITFTRNLIEGMKSANPEFLIYFSSVDVYGKSPKVPITEQTAVAPDNWYGMSKFVSEWILQSSSELGCAVAVLRMPGIFGPSSKERSVVGRLASDIVRAGRVCINGSGRALRDYVYIRDLCRLVLDMLPLKCSTVINVATGKSMSVVEIVQLIGDVLGKKVEVAFGPSDWEREFDLVFDNSLLRSLLPAFEFTDFRTAIRSYSAGV